jgi:N-acetyl-alpha-D-muramate 1-phosphate uridylyltransferase
MKVMLLAAGRGERLRPLTDATPKPLLDVGGEPLIAHQLRWLARAGLTEVVINLFHLGDQIADFVGDGRAFGVEVAFSHETVRLETGGGIVKALPLLGHGPFVVLNGDIWTDYPFERLRRALGPGDLAHLVLTPTPSNRSEGDFNLIDVGPTAGESEPSYGRIVRGAHRPFTQCGISVLSPELFRGIDRARLRPFSLRDLWFEAAEDDRVSGELWHGTWADIGSPEQLATVQRMASQGARSEPT